MVSSWDLDGHFKFELFENEIYLTVYPPTGQGRYVELEEVLSQIIEWENTSMDLHLISQVVSQMSGDAVKVGELYTVLKRNRVLVEVTHDELKAYLTLGQAVDLKEIQQELKYKGVTHNIDYAVVADMLNHRQFNKPVLIAQATSAIIGQDAQLEFHLNKDKTVHLKEDEQGKVDFKEIGVINTVMAGDVLVVKTPATKGVVGITVTGRELPARDGLDLPLPTGLNTEVSKDELSLLSKIDGQAIYRHNQVDVEPVLNINGDVNYKVGNIDFPGSVIIQGNVFDGFTIKASGNIEVKGYVERAELYAQGDIIIGGGIIAKSNGLIQAKGSIFANFVEQAHLEAEEDVIVNESIRYSYVDAKKRIIVQGHIGTILGGRVRAGEEINAKTIGSLTEAETILETGSLPLLREKIKSIQKELETDEEKIKGIDQGIRYLLNLKEKLGVNFPLDKDQLLLQHIEAKNSLKEKLYTMSMALPLLESDIYRAKEGKICASKVIFPGVKMTIRNASLVVKQEYRFVTFSVTGEEIIPSPYEAPRGIKVEFKSPPKHALPPAETKKPIKEAMEELIKDGSRLRLTQDQKEEKVIETNKKTPLPVVTMLKVRLISDPIRGVKVAKLRVGDEVMAKIIDPSQIKKIRDLLTFERGAVAARIEEIFSLDSSRSKVTAWLGAGILGETIVANKSKVKTPARKPFLFK